MKQTKSYDLIYSSSKSGKTKLHVKGEVGGGWAYCRVVLHMRVERTVHTAMNSQT